MSRNRCLVIAALAVFALAACSRPPMPSDQARAQKAAQSTPAPGETIAQLIALDQQAIASAEQARASEDLNEPVAELVETIYMQHRRNLTRTRALGDSQALDVVDTPAIREQRAGNAKQLKALNQTGADAYSRVYLETVIDNHQQALEVIDSNAKSTNNEAIRNHLQRTRDNFAGHLEMARALLES